MNRVRLSKSGKERARRGAVAEGLADMRVEIDVAGTENETAAELKRIRTKAMLPMAGRSSARPGFRVVTSKKMQQVRRLEAGRAIREPLRIYQ